MEIWKFGSGMLSKCDSGMRNEWRVNEWFILSYWRWFDSCTNRIFYQNNVTLNFSSFYNRLPTFVEGRNQWVKLKLPRIVWWKLCLTSRTSCWTFELWNILSILAFVWHVKKLCLTSMKSVCTSVFQFSLFLSQISSQEFKFYKYRWLSRIYPPP